jgi:hypothetical protein
MLSLDSGGGMRALFLALIGAFFICGAAKSEDARRQAQVHTWVILDRAAVGCPNLAIFGKLREAATSGDKEMFLTTTIYGGCKLFASGATLWVEEMSSAGGAVQVKAKGDKASFWIPNDAILRPAS